MLTTFLAVWYVYTFVMAVLLALSAGRRTVVGMLSFAAAAVSLVLMLSLLLILPPLTSPVALAAKSTVALAGVAGLVRGPREDTRLIALFLIVAAGLPLFLQLFENAG